MAVAEGNLLTEPGLQAGWYILLKRSLPEAVEQLGAAADKPEEDHGAKRGDAERGEIEAARVAEAQDRIDHKAAEQRTDDADDEVGEQAMFAAGDLLGDPAGDQSNKNPGEDTHSLIPTVKVGGVVALD